MPSWRQALLSDEPPEAFIIKLVYLGGERESLFLGGFLIFVGSAPHGLIVVGIQDNHNPPTIVLISSDADLDGVLLHVGSLGLIAGAHGTDRPLSGAATIGVVLISCSQSGPTGGEEARVWKAGLDGQHAAM